MKAHLRALLAELPPGTRLHKDRYGHLDVLLPGGEPLRDESGIPVKLPWSPSDHRSLLNTRARIRRALRGRSA